MRKLFSLAVLLLVATGAAPRAVQQPGASLADELLATDRRFAAAAAGLPLIDALTSMFREDVTMVYPAGFARGIAEATKILHTNPANPTSRAEWWPLRAGVSADGTHGFTVGIINVTKADKTIVPGKYISYWFKEDGQWKVAAYKRGGAASGEQPREVMAPSLPAAMIAPSTDAASIAAHVDSLRKAEQAFSDDAQVMGVGPAFVKWGRDDATNMGNPQNPGFTVGAAAIGGGQGPGGERPGIEWNSEFAFVASSGDLGITFGYIRAKDGSRPPFPFFTVWRRDGPNAPWRYIAE